MYRTTFSFSVQYRSVYMLHRESLPRIRRAASTLMLLRELLPWSRRATVASSCITTVKCGVTDLLSAATSLRFHYLLLAGDLLSSLLMLSLEARGQLSGEILICTNVNTQY